ncbi:glycosyltransferase family 39 protein [Pseudonocardia sp. 73-21]|jgi:hypothetical protein|uniref:glycosyltransferase family 39 protein n=1 Tax=Pseudonocardia sp. 73-21 TaxID=1895809 RepID=UPI000960E43C|nr:glycosyltransferase family 39 protein [Pseudonocardia sp. 73-21]OJY45268.1 MAG: hypothetical protein BGP03_15895 [Pseudonocardia sp. 73-21]
MTTTTLRPTETWRRGPVLAIAAATVALHLAFAAGYGYHRDELYFLAESKRLAWGFVSEQPFTPAVGWLSRMLFGDSVVGLRLWPALAGAGVVVIAALLAHAFGGRTTAQLTAGICAGTSTIGLSLFHLYGPTAFDQLAWAGCLFVLVKLLGGADPRWWLGFGAVAGLGLWNKDTLVLLAVALVVAVLLSPTRRSWLRSPWPYAGGLLAVLIVAPNLVWQAVNGWPMFQVAGTISEDQGGLTSTLLFLPMQVLTMNPLLAPVWVAGLWWLWRSGTFRPLAWMYVVLLVLLAVVGGRSYYLLPMYVPLFAAGAVAAQRFRWSPVAAVVAAVIILPGALPVLPVTVQRYLPFTSINPVLADSIGWPELVEQVAAVRDTLPAGEKPVVFTANYGEAGAIELLGAPYGLGQPVSAHNSYWTWGGPPEGTTTLITIGVQDRAKLDALFRDVRPAGTVDNGVGVDNEEQGGTIWVCREPMAPWSQLWPTLRHYNS